MRIAKVSGGTVQQVLEEVPENLEDVSGFKHLAQSEMKARGWLPVHEARAALGPYQVHGDPVVTVEADRVLYTYPAESVGLDVAKASKRTELNNGYETLTAAGFTSSALGAPHVYPSSQEAQMDLVGTVLLGTASPFACVNGAGVKDARIHTAEQIRQVLEDGAVYKLSLYLTLQEKLAAVEAAESVGAVSLVAW